MKTIRNLAIILACAYLTMGGCASLKEEATPPKVRMAASLLTSNALAFATSDNDRAEIANYLYAGAHGIRTLSGGKVPTAAEFQEAFKLFTKSGSKYVNLAQSLSAIWGGLYPQLQGNPKLAFEYLEALAAGVEDGAAGFVPAPS